jgi:cell division septum initiation protein DivIVA
LEQVNKDKEIEYNQNISNLQTELASLKQQNESASSSLQSEVESLKKSVETGNYR